MTKKLVDDRIDETSYISTGPNEINQLEIDIADLIGFDIDQLYEDSPFSFDEKGNITSERERDSPQVVFTDSEGVVGFRLWDTTNHKEVLISLENDYFIVYENYCTEDGGTGVLGGTADWKKRFKVSLHGGSGDTPGQDIFEHLNFPTSADEGKYLKGSGGEVVWGSVDVLGQDSCGVYHEFAALGNSASWADWGYPVDLDVEWDNNSMVKVVVGVDYIEIQTTGIYLMTARGTFPSGISGVVGVGHYSLSGGFVAESERRLGGNFDPFSTDNAQQVITGSWTIPFTALDRIYPKILVYDSNGGPTVCKIHLSVTKISEE
jgi:hypothetical protein